MKTSFKARRERKFTDYPMPVVKFDDVDKSQVNLSPEYFPERDALLARSDENSD